jgi:hypothetical protein
MGLFGRRKADKEAGANVKKDINILVGKSFVCRICSVERSFTKCWRRVNPLRRCQCCATPFENPGLLYSQPSPVCPKCGELLEQPGFDYALCDGCGSKFEVMDGTKPGLLPNKRQREEMAKHGKVYFRKS